MDVCCDVGCYRDNWFVGYGDLVSFGQGTFWVLIGATTAHPDNHYGTSGTVGGMKAVAEQYHAEFRDYDVIAINDLALRLGGTFDLNLNWGPPHYNHSRGKAVDVRGNGGPNSVPRVTEIQNRFMEICTQWGASIVLHESAGTANEHFHCEWS